MSDLDGYVFMKVGGRLAANDIHAQEWLSSIRDGREVMISARRPRNPKFHRLAFALLRLVVENTDRWSDEADLLQDLKLATGHVEKRVSALTGEVYAAPRSISFASMDEDKFKRWFNRAAYVLATDVLHVAPQTLIDEVNAMIEPRAKVAA